jgi:uncharacterized protein
VNTAYAILIRAYSRGFAGNLIFFTQVVPRNPAGSHFQILGTRHFRFPEFLSPTSFPTMHRHLTTLVCFLLCLSPLSASSSVWKVSRGDSVLYLGGTCHLLRPQDFPLPVEFDEAYEGSSKIVFETDMARLTSPDMHQVIATQGMFTDGTTLDKVVTPEAWKALVAYCDKAGLPMAQASRMKPWLFTIMVSAMELQKLGMAAEGVDLHYFKKASAEGKSLGQLESFERQIEFITQLGVGYESDLIEKTLEDLHEIPQIMEKVLKAWKSGDMSTLDRLMLDEVRSDYPEIFKTMIVERNRTWLPAIETMLTNSEVECVLVGVGHLPGTEGLLALLDGRGYKVEQLGRSP